MKFLDKRNFFTIDKNYKYRNEIFRLFKNTLINNDLVEAKILLDKLHYADIADLIDDADYEQRKKIFNILGDEFDSKILVELNSEVKNVIAEIINAKVFASKIDSLDVDEAVYILKDLDNEKKSKIISYLDDQKRDLLSRSLSYPENSAGRLMNRSVVSVPGSFTIEKTIDYIRSTECIPDDFYEIFVVNEEAKVIGGVLISRIMRADPSKMIVDVIDKNIIIINTHTDQEEVSYLFKQYSLVAAPIVNNENVLVGIIGIEDILDVLEEETEEDIRKMVGVGETDFHADKLRVVKQRFPWLFINLLTACLTSIVISIFTDTIESLVSLAAIMPVVASLGGNAGSQTLTVAVRAIANRELNVSNSTKTIIKEIIANSISGLLVATSGGIIIMIWQKDLGLCLVFATAIVINFTVAGFLGSTIPIFLNKMKTDPAVSSSVFLTALTDLVGFFTFLGLASLFLINSN